MIGNRGKREHTIGFCFSGNLTSPEQYVATTETSHERTFH